MDIVVDIPSWIRAVAGGAMIGTAAALLFALNGRIAGVSGVLGSLVLDRPSGEAPWRVLFIAGLVIGALTMSLLRPDLAEPTMQTGWPGLIVAGLLVGFGTRMGSGCTSGHGVCGIARLSKRSMVATLTFMAAGFATVFVLRHLVGGGP
jgi:uncharacterized protein